MRRRQDDKNAQTEREGEEERCLLFNLTWLSLVLRFVSLLQFCHRSRGSLKVTKYFLSSFLCVCVLALWVSFISSWFSLATLSSLSPLSARDPAPLCNRVPVYLARAHSSRERELVRSCHFTGTKLHSCSARSRRFLRQKENLVCVQGCIRLALKDAAKRETREEEARVKC